MEIFTHIDDNTHANFKPSPPHFSIIRTSTGYIEKMEYIPLKIREHSYTHLRNILYFPQHLIFMTFYKGPCVYDDKHVLLIYSILRKKYIGTISVIRPIEYHLKCKVAHHNIIILSNGQFIMIDITRYTHSCFQAELYNNKYMEYIHDDADIHKKYELQPYNLRILPPLTKKIVEHGMTHEILHHKSAYYNFNPIYDTTKQPTNEITDQFTIVNTTTGQITEFDTNPAKPNIPYYDFIRTSPTELIHSALSLTVQLPKYIFQIYYDILDNNGKIKRSKLIKRTFELHLKGIDYNPNYNPNYGIVYPFGINLILIVFRVSSYGIFVVVDYFHNKMIHMEIIDDYTKVLHINKHILTIGRTNDVVKTRLTQSFPDLYDNHGKTTSYRNFEQVRNIINMNIRKYKSYKHNGYLGVPNYILNHIHSYL